MGFRGAIALNHSEQELREAIADHGRQLFDRRFTHGSTGNLSVRIDEGILITPTGTSLGRLDPDRIAKVSFSGEHLSGEQPSKEAFLHLSMYRVRPQETAIVHLHSTWSVAVSCLKEIDSENVLPPITAYQQMRVGRCPLVPYFPPGDAALAAAVESAATQAKAMLLANHGPVVAAKSIAAAVAAAEELEETAKLFLLLRGESVRWLTDGQCQELRERFPD
jgi:ribulose-5-phosphate 4-epimerase/fuculose-1-phosphate aldolase